MFRLYRTLRDLEGSVIASNEVLLNTVQEYNNLLNISGKLLEEQSEYIYEVLYTVEPLI